jgi:hypothetical protein
MFFLQLGEASERHTEAATKIQVIHIFQINDQDLVKIIKKLIMLKPTEKTPELGGKWLLFLNRANWEGIVTDTFEIVLLAQ